MHRGVKKTCGFRSSEANVVPRISESHHFIPVSETLFRMHFIEPEVVGSGVVIKEKNN